MAVATEREHRYPYGSLLGLVVVDIDVHGVDGYESAARASRAGLVPAPLAEVRTPTGGRHLYFPADPAQEQRSWHVADAGVWLRGDQQLRRRRTLVIMLNGRRTPYRVEVVTRDTATRIDAEALRDFLAPGQTRCHSLPRRASGR